MATAHHPLGWLSELARALDGTSALEFALTAPVLLGLLVPVVDLGIAFSQQMQIEQAVQAGAQYASLHPWNSSSPTDISRVVTSASNLAGLSAMPSPSQSCGCPTGSGVSPVACGTGCSDGTVAGYYVLVSAQLRYTPIVPYSLLGSSTTLSAQSTVRIR